MSGDGCVVFPLEVARAVVGVTGVQATVLAAGDAAGFAGVKLVCGTAAATTSVLAGGARAVGLCRA